MSKIMVRFDFKQTPRWFLSTLMWFGLMMNGTAYAQLSDADLANYKEIPATIVALNLEQQELTMAELGRPVSVYRLAFGIKIQLLSGDSGTASNLSEGDVVTAIVDRKGSAVHVIYVVGHTELNGLQNPLN